MTDPITRIAQLVNEGVMIRHDGPYELHYPHIRNLFLKQVKARQAELKGRKKKKR